MKATSETIKKIRVLIGEVTGVDPQNFEEKHPNGKVKRLKEMVTSRYLLMYILRSYTTLTFKETGEQFNNKAFDHATALHAMKSINNAMDTDKDVKIQYESLFNKAKSIINKEKEKLNKEFNEAQKQAQNEKSTGTNEGLLREVIAHLKSENLRIISEYQEVMTAKRNIENEYRKVVSELKREIDGLQGDIRLINKKMERERMYTVSY
jgi:hypothetical protein